MGAAKKIIETTGTELATTPKAPEMPGHNPKGERSLCEVFQALAVSTAAPFVAREDVALGLVVATLAGEHVLMLGPPGTAKSAIARRFSDHFVDAKHFEWLLTRFSLPEEIFGPVSLVSLKEGRYERVPEGKLPEAHFAFLDEIFKANSAILNALLTAANERKWHNGPTVVDIPLQSIVAASNEMPEDESLDAFFDRFLLRYWVGNTVKDRNAFLALHERVSNAKPISEKVSLETLRRAQAEVSAVDFTTETAKALGDLAAALSGEGVSVSDRRWVKCVGLIKASAWLSGFDETAPEDLGILSCVLWSSQDQMEKVSKVVSKRATGSTIGIESGVRALMDRYKTVSFLGETYDDEEVAGWIRDAKRMIAQLVEEGKKASERSKPRLRTLLAELKIALKEASRIVLSAEDKSIGF